MATDKGLQAAYDAMKYTEELRKTQPATVKKKTTTTNTDTSGITSAINALSGVKINTQDIDSIRQTSDKLANLDTNIKGPADLSRISTDFGEAVYNSATNSYDVKATGWAQKNMDSSQANISKLMNDLGKTSDIKTLETRNAILSTMDTGRTKLIQELTGRGLGGTQAMAKAVAKYDAEAETQATLNTNAEMRANEATKAQSLGALQNILGLYKETGENLLKTASSEQLTRLGLQQDAKVATAELGIKKNATLGDLYKTANEAEVSVGTANANRLGMIAGLETDKAKIQQSDSQFNKQLAWDQEKTKKLTALEIQKSQANDPRILSRLNALNEKSLQQLNTGDAARARELERIISSKGDYANDPNGATKYQAAVKEYETLMTRGQGLTAEEKKELKELMSKQLALK